MDMSDNKSKRPAINRDPTTEEVPIIDIKAVVLLADYVRGSLTRQRRILTITSAAIVGLVLLMSIITPRSYQITTRILTHRSYVMPALVHPGRAVPPGADAPTRGAEELIKSRENLEMLVKDINFVELWKEKRGPMGRLKDKIRGMIHPLRDADIQEVLVKALDERLMARVEGDVVVMTVSWPDAQIAMKLAEGSVARFLKLRHDMELSEIIETVNILERSVETSRLGLQDITKRVEELFHEKELEIRERNGAHGAPPPPTRVVALRNPGVNAGAAENEETTRLRSELQEKQAAVESLKRSLAQRVEAQEAELATLRATLGPENPDVEDAQRDLETIKEQTRAPQELMQLQAEAARVAGQLARLGISVNTHASSGPADMVRLTVSEDLYEQLETDPEMVAVMTELRKKQATHDELLGRLEDARIEIETANVAFGYRYMMTEPPLYPKKPVSPNIPVMIVGGIFAALLFGVVMAVIADVLTGRILSAWQIERYLGVKLLGEIPE